MGRARTATPSMPLLRTPKSPAAAATLVAVVALSLAVPVTAQRIEPTPELRAAVATARLDRALLESFEVAALAGVADLVRDPELARWLERDAKARSLAAWVRARVPDRAVFALLQRLWTADPRAVRQLPALAFGIAAAWSSGSDEAPARAWGSWTSGREPVPTVEASLGWYREHRRQLPADIARMPWPLAALVGLNDVPLGERNWVLERYRDRRIRDLRGVFAEVPYIADGLKGKAETLPNMVEHGGVCTVNTQYAMSVLRTLGAPATFGGGPGHCWPCWVESDGRRLQFARNNHLGNRDGTLGQWVGPALRYESDLRRLCAALGRSAEGLRKADCAAAAARACEDGATKLLIAASTANPLSAMVWEEFARQLAAGDADPVAARTMLHRLPRALAAHPDAAVRCLRNSGVLDLPAEPDEDSAKRARLLALLAADLRDCCRALAKATAALEREDLDPVLGELSARAAELGGDERTARREYCALLRAAAERGDGGDLDRAVAGALRCATAPTGRAEVEHLLFELSAAGGPIARRCAEHHWQLVAEHGDVAATARARFRALSLSAGGDWPARDRLAGGGGGSPFVDRTDGDGALVGIRWSRGEYFGIPVVGSVQPLYRGGDGAITAGKVHGDVRSEAREVMIDPDQVLLGLAVTCGNVLDGFALISAPQRDGKVDLDAVRFSQWCGGGERGQWLLGGDGARIRGLRGRSGDVVDALGLLFE